MNLFLRNNKLDESLEHEIFSDKASKYYSLSPYGFTVIVIFNLDYCKQYKLLDGVVVYNNITEVHSLFDIKDNTRYKSIAFESDIHSTGGNKQVKDIDTVVIFNADKIEKHY